MARTFPSFTQLRTGQVTTDRMVNNLGRSLDDITAKEILDGKIIENIFVPTGPTTFVSHGLQRAFKGYIIIKRNADSTVWDVDVPEKYSPELFLLLESSADVTISIWIF